MIWTPQFYNKADKWKATLLRIKEEMSKEHMLLQNGALPLQKRQWPCTGVTYLGMKVGEHEALLSKIKTKVVCIRAKQPFRPDLIPVFCSMKQPRILQFRLGWDASPSHVYPLH